jgi:hypothetical protein
MVVDTTTVSVVTYVVLERAGQSVMVEGQAVMVAVRVLKTVEVVNCWLSSVEVVVWLATGTLVKMVDFEHLRVVRRPPVGLPLIAWVGEITDCDVLGTGEMAAEEEAPPLGFLTVELHEGLNGTAELERMTDGTAEDETMAEYEIIDGTAELEAKEEIIDGTAEELAVMDGTAEDETAAEDVIMDGTAELERMTDGTAEELAVTEADTTVLELVRDELVEDEEIAVGVTVAVVQEVVATPSLI